MDLFAVFTEEQLRAVLRRQKSRNARRNDAQWMLAEDFLENSQISRTELELKRFYPTRQAQAKGEQIQPFILPLADRYVAEAANAYNKPVTRELVDDNGDVNDDATDALKRLTEGLDERLHGIERYTVAQDAQPAIVQARRGKLDVQQVPLHQVHPVLPEDASRCNRSDQGDYLGHVIETDTVDKDTRKWVFMTPAAHYYYSSTDWSEFGNVDTKPNTMQWPQREMTDDDKEIIAEHPLQSLVWWHRYIPLNKLMPVSDVPVCSLNLEINIQISCMLDTLRKQGWSQLVAKVMDPNSPPTSVPMGAGFMMTLGLDEEIVSLPMGNDWSGMVGFLKFLVQLFAILLRQSPNDFAVDGTGPASGFAKLVDSLPKIEARNDRIRRLKAIEENVLWPRIGAVGRYLDVLPAGAENLHMRVKFAGVEFPQTVDERIKQEDHDIKHGYTTEAKVYAERHGLSIGESETAVAENKQARPTDQVQPSSGHGERRTIAQIVAQRKGEIKPDNRKTDA